MQAQFAERGIESGILKRIPMRRFGGGIRPSTAQRCCWPRMRGRYTTGAVIPVDGGQVLSWM
ncbi:hypothetical protein ACU4GD_36955 [Cupriavidus basilensis]